TAFLAARRIASIARGGCSLPLAWERDFIVVSLPALKAPVGFQNYRTIPSDRLAGDKAARNCANQVGTGGAPRLRERDGRPGLRGPGLAPTPVSRTGVSDRSARPGIRRLASAESV